jgi:hypothetical protein
MASGNINLTEIPRTALRVLMSPAAFFREMPRSGGYVEPLAFMVAMGVISGILQSILSLVGLQFAASVGMALGSIVIFPIMIAIIGFIGAAIMFALWKLMGSGEDYETSYRCVAYVSALGPIMTLLNVVPYLGSAVGLVAACFYYVAASVEVHGIPARRAWTVFGIITGIMIVMTVSAQYTARKMAGEAERMRIQADILQKQVREQAEALRKQSEEAARAAQRSAEEGREQRDGQPGGPPPALSPEQARQMQKAAEEMKKAMEKQQRESR